MNQDRLQGNWLQFKGKVKEQWGKLTDDDLDVIAGKRDLPIDPSLMTGFRKRIGESGCEFILGLTVAAGLASKTVAQTSLAVVNVDTTVQDKAVAFPTDARLLNKARMALVRLAHKSGVVLRQSYERVGKAAFVRSQRYAHARQMRRAKGQNRKLRTYLGRIIRDIERKTQGHSAQQDGFARLLQIARRIHSQPGKRSESDPPKLYSVHAPEVECIAKGKAHKQYEFGVKVGSRARSHRHSCHYRPEADRRGSAAGSGQHS